MNRINREYVLGQYPDALKSGCIQAYYQPIFRSVTGQICCAESLARWRDPNLGLLSPAEFIPVLEHSDLIYSLDMEILRQTCAFYQKMRRRGTTLHSFSVNLSRQDFKQDDLFERVTGILEEYDVPVEAIKLEITESIMVEDVDTFRRIFQQFHKAGFSIWIDDFGNAYSSLSMLQDYEFDMMKFDMLFMKNFSRKSRYVLASQINMAKTLNIHTLAEGVETKEQEAYLKSSGCETMQGFLFSKPIPEKEFVGMIDKDAWRLESHEDNKYWNQIGKLNFLSPNPLDDYGAEENFDITDLQDQNGAALALVECHEDRAFYIYASDSYLKRILELGYPSIDALEYIFNGKQSDQFLMMRKLAIDTVIGDKVQELDYINNNVFYKLRARCIARKKDRAMLALELQTFDSDKKMRTSNEMQQYGNALFSTYEIVTLVYPERGASTRVYASDIIPPYDNVKASTLKESIQKFCRAEIELEDQPRYLRFFDLDTLAERIGASSRGFIQDVFRLSRHKTDLFRWRSIRISKVPSDEEQIFLYTIQKLHPKEARIYDVIAREHPEILLEE